MVGSATWSADTAVWVWAENRKVHRTRRQRDGPCWLGRLLNLPGFQHQSSNGLFRLPRVVSMCLRRSRQGPKADDLPKSLYDGNTVIEQFGVPLNTSRRLARSPRATTLRPCHNIVRSSDVPSIAPAFTALRTATVPFLWSTSATVTSGR